MNKSFANLQVQSKYAQNLHPVAWWQSLCRTGYERKADLQLCTGANVVKGDRC